ncbi:telomere repeat-binding protein 5-like isoform X2 [Rutidosis leptorrhynchoides]|uniref:telomere repeat-binding protein 5-like isoform X2 n=1 Tax=Rutidosis leptorrhynchoides TaxID=125765 RepID=UPI003A9985B7
MVLQKRLEYGFNGYQVPPTPRAARSATRRVSFLKKTKDHNNNNNVNVNANKQMCAFDLLATVAGNLLQDGVDNESETVKIEQKPVENASQNVNICDQTSCNRSFFVSEIISDAPVVQDSNSGPLSGITFSDSREKSNVDKVKVKANAPFSCKVEDKNSKAITNMAPKPCVDNNNNNVKFPFCKDNVNLVVRDDDENFCGVTRDPNKTNKPPVRIGDRRIRRFLATKYWKTGHDDVNCDVDGYDNKDTSYKRHRSLKDYPFKKRRLYELEDFSHSKDVVNSDHQSRPLRKESIEDISSLSAKSEEGLETSKYVSKQNPAFHNRDCHVKLKIKSFRVPELFFELPKTATVGSLKTVTEAVTSILGGELDVGVMVQGKKIRDDDKTLLQIGIHNKLEALGFSLEPNHMLNGLSLCPEDRPFPQTPDMPKPLIRYTPTANVGNQLVRQAVVSDVSPDPPLTNFVSGSIDNDHESAPSLPKLSTDRKSGSDSRALVMVPAMNQRTLDVVPLRKCKRSEVAQRRIRQPFSVSEVEALVQAVEKLGTGRWRDVKLRAFDNAKHRTYVDLKDKWKTLVHTARISPQQRRGEPVPQQLLDRVLAAHAYWSHHQAKPQFKHQPQLETYQLL